MLEATVEEKDLGIIVDPHMNFHKQTAAAVSKASQMFAVVKRSFATIISMSSPFHFSTRLWSGLSLSTATLFGDPLERLNWQAPKVICFTLPSGTGRPLGLFFKRGKRPPFPLRPGAGHRPLRSRQRADGAGPESLAARRRSSKHVYESTPSAKSD